MEAFTTSRRAFLAGAAGLLIQGCTALRAGLGCYPSRYTRDEGLIDSTLRAFVLTVIPGAPADGPDLVRIFSDPGFPLAAHRGFLVYELSSRAEALRGRERFDDLTEEERTAVVRDGLRSGDGLVAQLYRVAVFAAQVSFFGGIYDDGRCELIDAPGPNNGFPDAVIFAPPGPRAREATEDGNWR